MTTRRRKYADIDSELLKALSHPLRLRILVVLNQGVASPSEIADELGESLGNISYHIKILEERGAIEMVKTQHVRGAVQHFYRALARPRIEDPKHWASLPPSIRQQSFDRVIQQIWEHVAEGSEAHGFDDPETHVSWTRLELDDEAYAELGEALAAVVDRALALHAESAGRLGELAEEEREPHLTELSIMHFHRAGPAKGAGATKRRRAKAQTRA
jgi:DNA-binding transcriptional ArsR family regulator